MARLRRLCERKPSGKINVPMWLHEQWLDLNLRKGLAEQLKECNMSKDHECLTLAIPSHHFERNKTQDLFVERQRVLYEKKKTKNVTTCKGWFSERTMKDELKWPELFSCVLACHTLTLWSGGQS